MSAAKETNQNVQIGIKFPLPDGRLLVQGPLTYNADGLATRHNADFLKDPVFQEAYRLGTETGRQHGIMDEMHIEWRVYVCCWAAYHAIHLPGDFVECGVFTGILSRAVVHYVNFEKTGKTFYLADTYSGIPEDQLTVTEKKLGMLSKNESYGKDTSEIVRQAFQGYSIEIIRGKVPDSLPQIKTDKICYLSIDMNIVMPEIAAAEYFWDKLVPGAIVVLDDYGWDIHFEQKRAFDAFAERKGVKILSMPTGQGLIIKP
ncbi:MAG: TylF/MycF/NovP-related O-methyltransferase [bacterium]